MMDKSTDPAMSLRTRGFGLRGASVDPELEGLLSLGPWVVDDPQTSVYLSGITRPAIRRLFPPFHQQIRTITLRSGLDLEADVSDVFAAMAALGWYQEADDFEVFMSLIEDGATVIDVGANFGLYAAHAALHAGPRGRVFAFEPEPESYRLLSGNLERNGLGQRCTPIRAAVGAETGTAKFYIAADSAFSGLYDTGRSKIVRSINTEVVSLDSALELRSVAPVDLIKIDVEGGEAGVLIGARELLVRSPDILVMFEFSEKNLNDRSRSALVAELERLGKAGFIVLARSRGHKAPVAVRPADLAGNRSENLFLCRPQSPVRSKLNALVGQQSRRTISPEQAAALTLLKRQAGSSAA